MLKMKDLSYQISDTRFNHSNYTTNKSIKLHCQQLLSPCNVSNYLSFKTIVSGRIQDGAKLFSNVKGRKLPSVYSKQTQNKNSLKNIGFRLT